MRRLGYDRYVAQGGDWGSAVTSAMATIRPAQLAAIHLNFVIAAPTAEDLAALTDEEKAALARLSQFSAHGRGYAAIQSKRPQTLRYGLTDSPAGQAAWIYEKLAEWMDCGGDPLSVVSYDDMLDNIMLYWLPANAASSARLYWESIANFAAGATDLPVALVAAQCGYQSSRYFSTKFRAFAHCSPSDYRLSHGG